VLARIQAEPVGAEGWQVVEVPGQPAPHVLRAGVEIGEVDQLAVLHLVPVLVVGHVVVAVAVAMVEIPLLVGAGVVVVGER